MLKKQYNVNNLYVVNICLLENFNGICDYGDKEYLIIANKYYTYNNGIYFNRVIDDSSYDYINKDASQNVKRIFCGLLKAYNYINLTYYVNKQYLTKKEIELLEDIINEQARGLARKRK